MICASMNAVLERWNELAAKAAAETILPCCGSRAWARTMVATRPLADEPAVLEAAGRVWSALPEEAWMEAFASHPRIGQREAPSVSTKASAAWSAEEQRAAFETEEGVTEALRQANARYEERFGRVFLVCATGRSAREILDILERRMRNSAEAELREAAEQQRQITALRLRRWMEGR